MAYETITYEQDDRIAIITLNRPKRMNALSLQLCAEVTEAVGVADKDDSVRVLVITGAGGKAFSAGYDIREGDEGMKQSIEEWWERLYHDLQFTYTVWNCSKPVIAMIDGFCLAGGLEFAQMCDTRYCSEDSKFAVIETRFSAGVATMVMPFILGPRCRELIYTGDMIDAQEALRLGLVSRIFPKDALRDEVMKIAKRMSQVALACLQWNKRSINNAYDSMGFRPAMNYGVAASTMLDSIETPEFREFDGIRRAKSFKEALKWRDEQFARYE
jgi:enoyl-CoA hydratase/carnithine racemase